MEKTQVVIITLIVYKLVLIAIGLFAGSRTKGHEDYFLGGRALGPWVASLSASASSSSAWTLLGVSGAAYAWGISAIWLFPSCLGGFLINWYLVAPRLRSQGASSGAITLTEFLAGPDTQPSRWRTALLYLASAIILFSFLFYVAAQFQGSGKTFQSTFSMSAQSSILLGTAIIVFYTLVGGFWAVSLTDALQGMVMVATAILLPTGALIAVGGFGELWQGMVSVDVPGFHQLARNLPAASAIGFVVGLLGIGLGYPGQPHVVNRFMAMASDTAVARGRIIAIAWAVAVYSGMLMLGWCGRVLFHSLPDQETVFFAVANQYFPPVIGGIMIAGVLSATMSTADSQLLVAASAISNDLTGKNIPHRLWHSRLTVLILSVGSALLALYGSGEIFSKVLFAWTAMGAAFGPALVSILWRGRLPHRTIVLSMASGFLLSVIAYSFPYSRGTWLERVVPILVASAICWVGRGTKERTS